MLYWLGAGLNDPALLGGKALGLDRLAHSGLPTPPGFCLTTSAYRHYLNTYGWTSRYDALLAELPDEAARQELEHLAQSRPLPDDLRAVLHEGLAQMTDRFLPRALFAVRSSAVGEDTVNTSFAGQHESVLGVSIDQVEAAIQTCWASLWSPRAVAYRVRRNVEFAGAAMAVVVQGLVPAEVSAVAFTKNPVNGRDDEIMINAAWGLGEVIVSGTITPDTILLDKATLQVRSILPGDKSWRIDARSTGGTEQVEVTQPGPALDESKLVALGKLCQAVEQTFGMPMDIEAAFTAGQWYLVQARPITSS
jgi:pyruvate,water dikinase